MSHTFEIGERVRNRTTGRKGTVTALITPGWLKVHWDGFVSVLPEEPKDLSLIELETPERNLNDLILDQLQIGREVRFVLAIGVIRCEIGAADPNEDDWCWGYGVSPLEALEDAITPPAVVTTGEEDDTWF